MLRQQKCKKGSSHAAAPFMAHTYPNCAPGCTLGSTGISRFSTRFHTQVQCRRGLLHAPTLAQPSGRIRIYCRRPAWQTARYDHHPDVILLHK